MVNIQYKILQSSLLLCPIQEQNSNNFKIGLYFLLKNNENIFLAGEQIRNYLFEQIEKDRNNLKKLFIILGICCVCITILQILFSVRGIMQNIKYKKHILVLIGRISLEEIDVEINKLTICQNSLSDIQQNWMNQDFIQTMLINQNDYTKLNKVKNRQNDNKQQSKQNYSRMSQKKVTSQIQNHRFSFLKNLIFSVFICLSGSLLLMIIIIIAHSNTVKFSDYVSLYHDTLETTDKFSYSLLLSDYLAVSPAIQSKNKLFPQATESKNREHNQVDLHQLLKDQIISNKSYFKNIIQRIESESQISSSSKQKIIDLLQNDMCSQLKDSYKRVCLDNQSPEVREIARKGSIALFTEFFDYFSNNDNLYTYKEGNPFNQANFDQIQSYANNKKHEEYIIYGFNIAVKSLQLIKLYLQQGFNNETDDLIKIGQIYLLCLCFPFMIFWIILIKIIYGKVKQQIINLNFSLTLIPYEKLLEENTVVLLKKINKF